MARFGDLDTQYFDDAGDPLINGKVYFYETGTSTPKTTYSDVNFATPNTNPVILTAAGRQPNVFFRGVAKAVLATSAGVQILVRDPVGETDSTFGNPWVSSKSYNANDVVQGSNGVFYVSLINGNVNNDPVTTSGSWTFLYSVEWSAGTTYKEGSVVTYDSIVYQSLQNANINKNPSTEAAWWIAITLSWVSTATYAINTNAVGPDGILYTSLQNANTGNTPATSPLWWVGTSAAAAASASAALASENAAALSETNAAASEDAAAVSETNAAASETAAAVSETNAGVSETNAAASAVASAASASASAISASTASAAATSASTSAGTAATQATIAINNALAAATSASSIADYTARVLAKLKTRGIPGIKSIVFKKREGWERTVQAAYTSETRPTGRFLGDYATATLAWAAAYLGVPTVAGDYYWNTTNDRQEECTTSNNSTVVYRGAQSYFPDEAAFSAFGSGASSRVVAFDLTDPLIPAWADIVVGETVTSMSWGDGRLLICTASGATLIDFKAEVLLRYSTTGMLQSAFTSWKTWSGLSFKTCATTGYQLSSNTITQSRHMGDGLFSIATSAGVSAVNRDGTIFKSSSTNAFKSVAILRGRLYAINDTASPESLIDFGPIDQLTASFAAVNTWTNATVPALSDSTLTKVVAAGDHLVIHGSTAVDELWPDTTTMANSLIARKTTTAATPPMKKPELMILAGTGTGSVTAGSNAYTAADALLGTGASLAGLTTSGTATISVETTITDGNAYALKLVAASDSARVFTGELNALCTAAGIAVGDAVIVTVRARADSTQQPASLRMGTSSTATTHGSHTVPANDTYATYTFRFIMTATPFVFSVLEGGTPNTSTVYVTGFNITKGIVDYSGKSNHATINGTLTATAHATGGVAMASGFTAANYLSTPYDADLQVSTGDVLIEFAVKSAGNTTDETLACRADTAHAGATLEIVLLTAGAICVKINGAAILTSTSAYDDSLVHTGLFYRRSGTAYLEMDGKVVASVANTTDLNNATAILTVGVRADTTLPATTASIALVFAAATSPTASEAAEIHKYIRDLIEGKAAFDELPSNLAYNELTDTIHCVGTTYEQTMRDGRVTVVGSHGVGTTPVIACGPRGEVAYGGSTNLTISVPERNLHEYVATKDVERFTIKYEGDASRVSFPDPTSNSEMLAAKGGKPVRISNAGSIVDEGAAEAWLLKQNSFGWWAQFAVAPSSGNNITVEFEREIYK